MLELVLNCRMHGKSEIEMQGIASFGCFAKRTHKSLSYFLCTLLALDVSRTYLLI